MADQLDPIDWAHLGLNGGAPTVAWRAAERQLTELGFETSALALDVSRVRPAVPQDKRMFGHLVSAEWHRHYVATPGLVAEDPLARHLATSEAPGFWYMDREGSMPLTATSERRFLRRVTEFGMCGTLAFSTFDRCTNTFSAFVGATLSRNDDFEHVARRRRAALQLAIEYFVEALRLVETGPARLRDALSPRERECLLWASVGRTTAEIAGRLTLSEHTVDAYLGSARRKLGASSRAQACVRALVLELIAP